MTYDASPAFAAAQDAADPLKALRHEFHFPPGPDGQPVAYFCGNSLGLLPRAARAAVEAEFQAWETKAVEGHFHGESPWMYYQDSLAAPAARVVGAQPLEVVIMNTLTVNLHLLLISFYQPTPTRYKVLMEGGAFPSDQYALESQARLHGLDPAERFQMQKGFRPAAGAAGWQLSCGQVLPMAVHRVNLDLFDRAGGVGALRTKSEKLTGYLEFLINQLGLPTSRLEIITPPNPAERGCQLSLLVHERGRELFDYLAARGVVADWREPNVIRLAPVPLYNSFEDVYRVGAALLQFYSAQ